MPIVAHLQPFEVPMPKDHSPFALWLSTELEKSELSPIELSKCANIHKGTLSNILNGKRSPTLDICNAIAYFWGLPQEFVLHKAGIVQDIPESDEEDYRLWIQAFRTLPGADKKEILALMCLKAQEGIKMISDEAMFKSLKHQGVIFFQNTHEDDEVGTIHVSELFAAMIRHPQARVRQAVIASLRKSVV